MPGNDGLLGLALVQAVQNGTIPEARINDMITRLLTPYYLLEQDQGYPTLDLDRDSRGDNYEINRQISMTGMILLKNINNVLPLNVTTDKNIFIYGEAASRSKRDFGSYGSSQLGGALYQGGGSGYVEPTYSIDPLTSLMLKGRDAHLQIRSTTEQFDYIVIDGSFRARGFQNAKCLVFISSFSQEIFDRINLHAADYGDKLVNTIASHCANTIVIVNSVSQLNLEAWIDHPNVTGVIWSGMPGSEYGPAIANVLFGDFNPGGKLVFTLAKNDSDYGTDITETLESNYTEGVFLDYRHFDKYNIVPRYYFGYGLSYTNFSFSQLVIIKSVKDKHSVSLQYQQRSYTKISI
jgi:beta-glucosidase